MDRNGPDSIQICMRYQLYQVPDLVPGDVHDEGRGGAVVERQPRAVVRHPIPVGHLKKSNNKNRNTFVKQPPISGFKGLDRSI